MAIPLIILMAVFALIAIRQVGKVRLQIWQIMLAGALIVLVTGQITPLAALQSINLDVMLFLFGMFVVGTALEQSGYLSHLSSKLFGRARSPDRLVLFILLGIGSASAFLMNDTLAIIGTPVVLILARENKMSAKPLLLALAFAVTIGSVMSPIGNPQNLLIAINGNIANPFITFFGRLLIPTVINLVLAYILLRLYYREYFRKPLSQHQEEISDEKLARLSKISLVLIVALVVAKILTVFMGLQIDFRLTYIALLSALPILVLSPRRIEIARNIDWQTLIFFGAMFVLMESVWETGLFQSIISESGLDITSIAMILIIGVLLSQLISNVPLVALYLPLLIHAGAGITEMVALAAASTIAGNLTILGAASNVIIIQNAEKRAGESFSFIDFVKVGVPLTIVNIIVYWIFLVLV